MNATHSKLELNLVHKKPGLKVAPITGFNFFGYNETPLGMTMTKNGARFNPTLDFYFAERRYYAVNAEPSNPLFDFTTDVVFAWENKKHPTTTTSTSTTSTATTTTTTTMVTFGPETSPTATSSSETTETTTASETFGPETSPTATSSFETTETTTASETFGPETLPTSTSSSETTETTTASETFGPESPASLSSTSSSTPNATTTSNLATSFNYIDAKHSFITLLALNTLFLMLY